ncbi:MAG TPA: non-canonical purine NTP pyrophosphatase, partial [Allosphingosinicella sp.]|nr:non-canonical purine NTP pyrophosphatase [Allosphingosinicella sp.]
MRKLEPGRLVIASHNPGKVREIAELLGPYGIEPVSAAELDLPEPDEIGATFIDNADLKARAAADLTGLPALADDSGLCVEALGDRPGIFSARWAYAQPRVDPAADPGQIDGERDFNLAM